MIGGLGTPISFTNSVLIAAGGSLDALTGWQYETPRVGGMLEVIERATATGLLSEITSEGDTIKQRNPVQSGGTAGVIPNTLNTQPITGRVQGGRKNRVFYQNPTAGGITIDFIVTFVPIAGPQFGGGAFAFARRRKKAKK